MYPSPRLDTPPPTSQFRRPWSPEPFHYNVDDYRPQTPSQHLYQAHYEPQQPYQDPYHGRRPREPSEVSVEALDLADYAMTLRRPDLHSNISTPYPPFDPHDPYLQSSPPLRTLASRDTFRSPPSLVSAGGSSSQTHSHSSHTHTSSRRPFSLPPVHLSRYSPDPYYGNGFHEAHVMPPRLEGITTETDLANVPDWSRSWYDREKKTPLSHWSSRSPYDINRTLHDQPNHDFSPRVHPSSDRSHRNLLPWSDPEHPYGSEVTDEVKQERMRMLELEFGPNSRKGVNDLNETLIGSVNAKGDLITSGPKKRVATRCVQGLFALAAAISSLYSALILKPLQAPPPRGKLPAYVLYFLSVVTVLLILYLFVFRPCCCAGKRKKGAPDEGPLGMMVLPVQSLPGGGGKKKKKGKGGKKGQSNDGVQVNLIVDPSMFGGSGRGRDREWEDGSDGEDASSEGRRQQGPKRRGVFEGLAVEGKWRQARSLLKWMLFFDISCMVLWGVALVLILLGKRCPAGQFNGWCDGYNIATALASFLSVAFGLSVFFDIKDLHASSVSPRTRT